jgi:hypothetical protein
MKRSHPVSIAIILLLLLAALAATAGDPGRSAEQCCTDYATLRGAVIDAINLRERTGVTPEARELVMRALARTGEQCRWIDSGNGTPVPVLVCD